MLLWGWGCFFGARGASRWGPCCGAEAHFPTGASKPSEVLGFWISFFFNGKNVIYGFFSMGKNDAGIALPACKQGDIPRNACGGGDGCEVEVGFPSRVRGDAGKPRWRVLGGTGRTGTLPLRPAGSRTGHAAPPPVGQTLACPQPPGRGRPWGPLQRWVLLQRSVAGMQLLFPQPRVGAAAAQADGVLKHLSRRQNPASLNFWSW